MNEIGKDGTKRRTNRDCGCCKYIGQIGINDVYLRSNIELYTINSRSTQTSRSVNIANYQLGKYANDELARQMYELYTGEDNTSI